MKKGCASRNKVVEIQKRFVGTVLIIEQSPAVDPIIQPLRNTDIPPCNADDQPVAQRFAAFNQGFAGRLKYIFGLGSKVRDQGTAS